MISKLCLADGFDMFPTIPHCWLVVTDGSCMIDRSFRHRRIDMTKQAGWSSNTTLFLSKNERSGYHFLKLLQKKAKRGYEPESSFEQETWAHTTSDSTDPISEVFARFERGGRLKSVLSNKSSPFG